MNIVFKLSMPGRASWNGRWSGEGNLYAIVKNIGTSQKAIAKVQPLLEQRYFSHAWGDGWRASIEVTTADPSEIRRIRRLSKGFCGYDWMVNNILSHGNCYDKKPEPATT